MSASELLPDRPPLEPCSESSLLGAIDKISPNLGIVGWAVDRDAPMDVLSIELFSHGVLLGSCRTGQSRNDVTQQLGVMALPGFCLQWDAIDAAALRAVLRNAPEAGFSLEVNGTSLAFVLPAGADANRPWKARDLQRFIARRMLTAGERTSPPIPAIETTIFHFAPHLPDDALMRLNFDPAYYRTAYPDLAHVPAHSLFEHFRDVGWREGRNPSALFSIKFYLETNTDIAAGGENPFTHFLRHGHAEGRRAIGYIEGQLAAPVTAKISVIVPNYNHARFLPARLNSILDQSYSNIELIILDDASTDNSIETIRLHLAERKVTAKIITRETNSGSVFQQWRRGIEAATGSLIWICESDDLAELDFLQRLTPYFNDPSVMLAFGRIQYCNRSGVMQEGLDQYRENAEAGIWSKPCIRTAHEWFQGAFGVANVIANVGGCLIRAQPIDAAIWDAVLQYKILGDWYLYLVMASGGRIAYDPHAVTYFRQHGNNTSVQSFRKAHYYREHEKLGMEIRRRWNVGDGQALRLFHNTLTQFRNAKAESELGSIDRVFDLHALLRAECKQEHLLICFVGFHVGGGELFPINLANVMVARGYLVSALVIDNQGPDPRVRAQLDPRIAIYDRDLVEQMGTRNFLRLAGITMIHSHNIGAEFLFFGDCGESIGIPYVVTLHGSYEVTSLPELLQLRMLKNVSRWTCLAKNNLQHLTPFPVDPAAISFIPNGMPVNGQEFPLSRAEMIIPEDALVFALASRAIPEKGWEIAIRALLRARDETAVPLYLLLAGSGAEAGRLEDIYWREDNIRFLGFQREIYGLYRLSDCALLPTRFPGESYPLCLIEAMQVGCPIIATDMGEISRMVVHGEQAAGIILEASTDDEVLIETLAEAMLLMTSRQQRAAYAAVSLKFGEAYDIQPVADHYEAIFTAAKAEPERRAKAVASCLSEKLPAHTGLQTVPAGLYAVRTG